MVVKRNWKAIVFHWAVPKSLQLVVSGFIGFLSASMLAFKSAGFLVGLILGLALVLLPMWPASKLFDRLKQLPPSYEEWTWLLFCFVYSSPALLALAYTRLH